MKVVNKYIAVEMLKSTAVAVLFLLSLVLVITFADELDDMGKGQYGLVEIFKYLALIAPRNFYELLPSAALLGALITLGGMANNYELTAMRAAGISRWQIIFSALRVGMILMVVSLLVSEGVAPVSEQAAQMLKFTAKNEQVALRTKYGFWTRDGDTYLNIREILNSAELKDVSIYEMTDMNELKYATHAKTASFIDNKWELSGVEQTTINDAGVKVALSDSAKLDSLLDPGLLDVIVVKPERLSIMGLASYINFLDNNGQDATHFIVAMTSKLIRPFVILVMLLIAIPMVLGVKRAGSTGTRILIGALIGIGFNLVDRLFGNIGVLYGLNPVIAASLPFFLALCISAFTIRRMG
ncbi:LPS export ABC transporter permease LptG [Cycloclasticus pugetii]|uniref:LPS export ABC transporter permease LptG n=1 Tax=Cycloclasticus pugetii TaxID=34068 RepID=UPI00035D17C1|nr:LPS export ABC transporter permease LptG [Cycloclasticus pugetii]